ncbi:Probable fatty-acid-CoA ligase FadD [Mycobacteroides abscessus]|nr:Probable fatty-acid-CoA ligase FadD [Mycobacteroides abscessus]
MLLTSLHPKSPDLADAVRIGEDSWGRGDLVGAATAAAERIGGASGPIAVLARPSIDTVLAVVAGLIAGVPIVPVPADVGIAERRHILADSAAVAWLGESPDESEGLPHVPVRRHARSWHQYSEPDPESTALIVYTSGTTGAPKGVRLSRRALAASLDGLADAWEWTADDVLVHGLPLFHVHGLVLGLLGSLRVGNRFVHTVKPTPEAYAAARGSLYFGVPTVWSRVAGMNPVRAHCLPRACWYPAVRHCRCLCSTSYADLPGMRPSSAMGPPKPSSHFPPVPMENGAPAGLATR